MRSKLVQLALLICSANVFAGEKNRCEPRLSKNWRNVENVTLVIKFVAQHFPDLNLARLEEDDERLRSLTLERFGRPIGVDTLQKAATKLYGTWAVAVGAAGLPTEGIRSHLKPPEWTAAILIEVLRKLSAHGVSFKREEFLRSRQSVRKIMIQEFQRPVSPKNILSAAKLLYGDWILALRAAAIPDADRIGKSMRAHWTEAQVVEVLKFLSKHFANMNLGSLMIETEKVQQLSLQKFGRGISPNALRIAAAGFFPEGWPSALDAAGISRKGIRTRSNDVTFSKPLLDDVLYFLSKNRVDLRLERFLANKDRIRVLTYERYHKPLAAFTIYIRALEFYGGWKQATEEFQFLKDEGLPAELMVINEGWDQDGFRKRTLGTPSLSPEESLIKNQEATELHRALKRSGQDQKQLGVALLNFLEDHDDLSDEGQVLGFLERNLDFKASWSDIVSLLISLEQTLSE